MEPKSDGQLAIGAFFVILGLLLLLNNLFPYLNFWKLWPLLLIFAGVMMLIRKGRGDK